MRNPRALPLLAVVASLGASPAFSTETARPVAADVAQLLQAMQERLTRLEARNAELERRLAEPTKLPEAVGARLAEVENGAWGREGDRIGFAYGALKTSTEYVAAASGGVAY